MAQTFLPGDSTWIACDAPIGRFSAVFEDDGETAYFYAVERVGGDPRILDAVHVYNVRRVTDREQTSELEIRWTPDGRHAALYINHFAHAVFDFAARCGCCRTGFPPPASTGWSTDGHAWRDDALAPFDGA